ncbi:hypothetical protein, partial [Rothia sp. HMSC071F11]|uniref:hypothetical protein n=1 Tax=Rothia sp. HMSC071F11 TaxID=1715034 RepID=UPI001AEF5CFA
SGMRSVRFRSILPEYKAGVVLCRPILTSTYFYRKTHKTTRFLRSSTKKLEKLSTGVPVLFYTTFIAF